MKILTIIDGAPTKKQVAEWKRRIIAAETEASAQPGSLWHYFLISYRVSSSTSKTNREEAARRGTLVALIESMKPREQHLSTSTFIIRTHIDSAEKLVGLLCGPLDRSIDTLHVCQVSPQNRSHWGHSDLEP